MRRVFSFRDSAVVTGDAGRCDIAVIIHRITPAEGPVTIITVIATEHVIRCFTISNHTIVAILAAASHCEMINSRHIVPARGLMTELALLSGSDMLR